MAENTYNTKNYFAHGGNELVIGGKLTFLDGSSIQGGDGALSVPTFNPAAYVADSEATTVAVLKENFNSLLAALKAAGLMASTAPGGST